MKPPVPWARMALFTLLASVLTGCQELGYYSQAVTGHLKIMAARRPIDKVMADPATPARIRVQLALARKICAFAQNELHLPAEGHYDLYADIGRKEVVWNVFAAPRYSTAPKKWWYPFIGKQAYRGYFGESAAYREATQLKQAGWDTYLGGVEVYSTLGWFNDPLLNTFIDRPEPLLAECLFHELAHHRVFIDDDTEFNEAFASAVGRAGARAWLAAQGNREMARKYEQHVTREDQVFRLFRVTGSRLSSLYDSATEPAMMERRKRAVLQSAERDYQHLLAGWGFANPEISRAINNARLSSVATYQTLAPAFLHLQAAYGSNWAGFYHQVEQLGRSPKNVRRELLLKSSEEASRHTPARQFPSHS